MLHFEEDEQRSGVDISRKADGAKWSLRGRQCVIALMSRFP